MSSCEPCFSNCIQAEAVTKRAADLLLLDRLQNFDYALLVVNDVDSLEHLTVLATPNLADDLIVVLIAAGETRH